MLSNKIFNNLLSVFKKDLMPEDHVNFLKYMKNELKFEPKVCYDIGAAVLHWTRHVEKIWNNTEVILFDAFEPVEFLYKTHKYNIGLLSDKDNLDIKFYQNDLFFGGNSYYKEYDNDIFPESNFIIKKSKTLDTVVKEKCFPLPDLIKIDVQGAELDILKGATETLKHCKYLIVELQDINYNIGAPLANITIKYLEDNGWILISSKFSDNGPDGDYCFKNTNNK